MYRNSHKEMENNVKILEADNIASLLKELKCSETEFWSQF